MSVTLGTGKLAGTFKNAVIDLAVGGIDTNGDTCGCPRLDDVLRRRRRKHRGLHRQWGAQLHAPQLRGGEDDGALGNYVDAVKASGFPIGDTVVAQECDASVSVPVTVSTNCDAATEITGAAGTNGEVVFSPRCDPPGRGAYSDSASGTCQVGGTCNIGVTDANNVGHQRSAWLFDSSPRLIWSRRRQLCSGTTSTR